MTWAGQDKAKFKFKLVLFLPGNIPRFKDVAKFLEEDLERQN